MDGSTTIAPPRRRPSLAELIARSDFGRADPERARELLDRAADPLTEDRNETRRVGSSR